MIRYRFLRVLSLILVMLGLVCSSALAAGIHIVPSSTQVTPGEDFFFDVVVEGIPAAGLGGVQFRLTVAPSTGTVVGVSDLNQAGPNDIAVVTPLIVSPAVAGRSGIGDFFWNGKGPNGILVMDNETLTNGSALYTFAHTNGATPPSGSGTVARFAVRIASGATAERLDINLSDVLLLDGGPAYPLEYSTGATVQLRCMAKVPSLLGLDRTSALAALANAKLALGSVYEVNNSGGTRPLNVVLEQSSLPGNDLLCQTPVNLAINTPPVDVAAVVTIDKPNDESGAVLLSWTPSTSPDAGGYRVYANGSLLKQLTGAAVNGAEVGGLANGVVTSLKVTAYDTLGNESTGAFVNALPIDDVPPAIAITNIGAGSFFRLDVTPQVTVTDASPVTWSTTLNGTPFSIAPVTADGTYTLTASAVDKAGNTAMKSVSFTVDKSAPLVGVAGVADGAYYSTSVSPLVTISDTNLTASSVTLDGQPYTSGSQVIEAGSHTLLATAEDQAGNSASRTVRFTIDTVAPMLTVSTLADNSYTNNEVLNISGTVSDDQSVKELTVNGTTVPVQPDGSFSQALVLANGVNTITVTAADQAGNQTSDTRTISLDQKVPLIDVISPADNSKTGRPQINVTGNVDETSTVEIRLKGVSQPVTTTGGSFSASIVPEYGCNTIEIIATDLAGNRSSEKRTVIFDDQKPSLAIAEPGQDIRTNRDILILKGTVADALTAVTLTITLDGQTFIPVVTDGAFEQRLVLAEEKNYAIVVTASDEVGNSISVQRNVIFDVTPPTLTIDPVLSPTNQPTATISGTREEGSTISVSCTGAVAGVIEYPTATTWTISLSDLASGDTPITAIATDNTGNETTATTHIIRDITPPTGTITINNGAGITPSPQVTLALTASDAIGVTQMQLSNDNTTWTASEAFSGTRAWSLLPGDGQKQVFVKYSDTAGNWSTSIAGTIILDATPPSLSASPGGGTYGTAQVVGLTTSEPAVIYCTTDGTVPDATSAVYGAPLTITATTTLRCLAVDSAGNRSDIQTGTYIIDTAPPLLHVSTLADNSYTSNNVLNVSGTVKDDQSGIANLTVNTVSVPVNPDGSFSQAVVLINGANTITVIATDQAGNQTGNSRTITLDQKAPTLVITAPADNSKTASALATINGTVDENSTVSITLGSTIQTAAMDGATFSADLTLAPGLNTVEVTATDLAGNVSTQKRTIIYDDQVPSLAVTVPNQDIRTNQAALLLKGTASDPYTAVNVTIAMDGQTFSPPVANGQFEQLLNFTTEKSYGIVVTAVNEVGRSATVQRNVLYDITTPVLAISPVTTPTTQTGQTITGTLESGLTVTVACTTATVGTVTYLGDTTWSVVLSAMQTGDNIVTVTSTDNAGNTTTVSTRITVAAAPAAIFTHAVFAHRSVTLSGGSYLDSYAGSPASYVTGQRKNGNVGTNSLQLCGISLTGGTRVYGTASVGTGGSPSTGVCMTPGTTVTGGSTALESARDMTPVADPGGITSSGALTISGAGTRTLTSGDYRYSSVNLSGSGKLTLSGRVTLHVDGTIALSGAANIVVAPGSSAVIYANGAAIDISGGAIVNSTQDPANFIIYGSSALRTVNLSGGTSLYGLLYAPVAAVRITGGQQTFGSIIANTVELSGGTSVHYPEGLER